MQSHLAMQPFATRWRHSQLQNGERPSDVAQYILALLCVSNIVVSVSFIFRCHVALAIVVASVLCVSRMAAAHHRTVLPPVCVPHRHRRLKQWYSDKLAAEETSRKLGQLLVEKDAKR